MAQFWEAAKKDHQEQNMDSMYRNCLAAIRASPQISAEERNIAYISFKCVTGKRRHELKTNPNAGAELQAICAEVIELLNTVLIPVTKETDGRVFLYKVLGDYYRYYDEVTPSDENKNSACQCYQTAMDWAASGLAPTNPLRLNVALNFGVYYQDTLHNTQKGLEISGGAIDAARASLAGLPESERAEASFVLQMLFDNATMWAREVGASPPAEIQGLFTPPPPQGGQVPPEFAKAGAHPGAPGAAAGVH
eukprot:NODE_1245_length_939_cov_95.591133_g1199_i0.p1 GENE.NODE_1245_length_939_cov_95.591133_g1199_i0~~NODE_1245_length_939_cov_95.591133_g1199_i0.p1  ORF type:complete len:250 (-),score=70.69 NODE_1245_length_939_cov_95.591133_g1199_i0:106-855(-)